MTTVSAGNLSAVVPTDASGNAAATAKDSPPSGWTEPIKPPPSPGSGGPVVAWDSRSDAQAADAEKTNWRLKLVNSSFVALSGLDNCLSYLTYLELRSFDGRLYNLTDLNIALTHGLDIVLLIGALFGTASFIALIVFVECLKKKLFHELMNIRLIFSAFPCAAICTIMLYVGEENVSAPIFTIAAIICNIGLWCIHMRLHYSDQLSVYSKISLDASWFLALVFGGLLFALYCSSSLSVITQSDEFSCPFAKNKQMPVKLMVLNNWHCAPWDDEERAYISRTPVNSVPRLLTCGETFVGAFGVSIDPHRVHCPMGCMMMASSSHFVGCGSYSVDSAVCMTAIHAGVLTDAGGIITVYGQLGLSSYESCSRYSLQSEARSVTPAGTSIILSNPGSGGAAASSTADCTVTDGSGASSVYPCSCGTASCGIGQLCTAVTSSCAGRRLQDTTPVVTSANTGNVPQAFHFNNLPATREFIWLKRFDEVTNDVDKEKPWTRMEGTVSLRVGGIELHDQRIRLGQYGTEFGVAAQTSTQPACVIGVNGVICEGNGAAVVQLDFCQPDVKTCLD